MAWPDTPPTEDCSHHASSEETPLLHEVTPAATSGNGEDPRDRYKWPVIILAFSLIFMIELSVGISFPAWNALLEKGICAEIHPELSQILVAGDENPMCKDAAVQGKLAMYRGWSYTLECIPTMLLAVPYGSLSDSWGRKPVTIMAFTGLVLVTVWYEAVFYFAMPMWTFFLAFVWYFLGGGIAVGVSMLYTMLADVVHVEELASVLFRFFATFMVGALIANPLGGFLLSKSPWVALITGNIFMAVNMAALYLLPETLIVRQWHDAKAGKTASQSPPLSQQESGDEDGPKKGRLRVAIDSAREQLLQVQEFIVSNRSVFVLMMPLIFQSLGKYIEELLLQYATKRYGWSWSKASYVHTLKSASFILMLTVILPAISTFCLSTLGMSPLAKDLWLARWSGVVLILADLVITFSYTPSLYAFGLVLLAGGCGLPPLLRSLLNALVEPHHVGILNTLLGILDTMGIMIAAPIFSQALRKGIDLGGGWIGLPFAAGTGITLVATVIMWAYRLPRSLRVRGDDV
ncbi:hypothetical protein VM1G_10759 [Cytospora mali]|uniref:Major facilitator superfamily (MFS) profile domain-containing protein n=1 Tax=Cytospora mali TaxID=578113 RepID=A0A194VJC1_CYTMA|nr:hypothetical protein VM1G_10759 [Valsa mali]